MATIRRKIGLNVTNKEYKNIRKRAKKKNLNISDYLVFKLGLKRQKTVCVNDVLKKIPNVVGKQFSIPDLFDEKDWKQFTKGSRIAVGKAFHLLTKKSGGQIKIEFVKKTSGNLAVYKVIT